MAHVLLNKDIEKVPRREWFVVDQRVGTGGANIGDDVFLVQFLLRVASETARGFAGIQPPGEGPLVISGSLNQQTQKYIKFYQEEINRRTKTTTLFADGAVDPVRPGQKSGSLHNTFYTILDLNVSFRSRRGDGFRIETDPLFPPTLIPRLFI
ncbi:MAG: hypothetical protein ACRCVA_33675 [Phreatobacter sp.]